MNNVFFVLLCIFVVLYLIDAFGYEWFVLDIDETMAAVLIRKKVYLVDYWREE